MLECDTSETSPSASLYHPSSGTEGADFIEKWCGRCVCDANEDCPILAASFCGPVDQWRYERGEPICTAFEASDPLNLPFMRSAAIGDLFPGARRRPSQGEQIRMPLRSLPTGGDDGTV